jgi:hypothetical protein
MSHPTKALCPTLLEDYNKVVAEQQAGGVTKTLVQQNIANAMKAVIGIGCRQRVCPFDDTAITAYYAGHVLGAVMFHIEVGGLSVFYTGDFNTQSQHHLGVADVPHLLVSMFPLRRGCCSNHMLSLIEFAAFGNYLRKHFWFAPARRASRHGHRGRRAGSYTRMCLLRWKSPHPRLCSWACTRDHVSEWPNLRLSKT